MIDVTRLDGRTFTLNAELIEMVESNPDTFIRLVNGNSFVVRESRQEIVRRVVAYHRQIYQDSTSVDETTVGITLRGTPDGK